MAIDPRAAWALRDALADAREATAQTTDVAEVTRIDDEGTVWVHIAGGVAETPVNGTLAASVGVGDMVTVSVENGRLSVTGNSTTPAVGQRQVEQAVMPAMTAAAQAQTAARVAEGAAVTAAENADAAQESAGEAATAAEQAIEDAGRALDAAETAQSAAEGAQGSADSALASARTAMEGLATVQDVAGTLAWIAEHGAMTATTDTEPDPTKVYFVEDPDGEYAVDGVSYSIVAEPKAEDMGDYFELGVDRSIQNYLTTHLALMNDGLHVFGESGRIIIGETADFHISISPVRLSFYQGAQEVAYVSNNELHIPRAVVTEGLQVGHYRWVELGNGGLALKYIDTTS